jgi:hypothetical protein
MLGLHDNSGIYSNELEAEPARLKSWDLHELKCNHALWLEPPRKIKQTQATPRRQSRYYLTLQLSVFYHTPMQHSMVMRT